MELIFRDRSCVKPLDKFDSAFSLPIAPRVFHGGKMGGDAVANTEILINVTRKGGTSIRVATNRDAEAMDPGPEELDDMLACFARCAISLDVLGVGIDEDQPLLTLIRVEVETHGVSRGWWRRNRE